MIWCHDGRLSLLILRQERKHWQNISVLVGFSSFGMILYSLREDARADTWVCIWPILFLCVILTNRFRSTAERRNKVLTICLKLPVHKSVPNFFFFSTQFVLGVSTKSVTNFSHISFDGVVLSAKRLWACKVRFTNNFTTCSPTPHFLLVWNLACAHQKVWICKKPILSQV